MSVFFMDFDMAPSVIWARDLYDQMQIRSDFRKWFPRMCQYGFVEGRDYEFVPRVRPQDEGGRTVQRYVKDYRITLEMAKQLYKLHHFHKNDCFRSCEGQHCMGTDHWMQAVIELLHQHKCKSHAPPKRFYESQPPDSLVTTTQMHYNPFHYIRSEKDILKLVNTIIANTKGDGEKSGEDFWVSATRSPAVRSWRTRNYVVWITDSLTGEMMG